MACSDVRHRKIHTCSRCWQWLKLWTMWMLVVACSNPDYAT